MPHSPASRYARALVDLLMQPSSKEDPLSAVAQLGSFEAALASAPELSQILLTPAVPLSKKRALVMRIGGVLGCSRLVLNFLCVIIDHRRIGALLEIRQAVQAVMDERLGLLRVEVESARPLTPAQQEALKAGLAHYTGQQLRSDFSVNESLIGGVIARVGSTTYDGSVRGRLRDLRRHLVEAEV